MIPIGLSWRSFLHKMLKNTVFGHSFFTKRTYSGLLSPNPIDWDSKRWIFSRSDQVYFTTCVLVRLTDGFVWTWCRGHRLHTNVSNGLEKQDWKSLVSVAILFSSNLLPPPQMRWLENIELKISSSCFLDEKIDELRDGPPKSMEKCVSMVHSNIHSTYYIHNKYICHKISFCYITFTHPHPHIPHLFHQVTWIFYSIFICISFSKYFVPLFLCFRFCFFFYFINYFMVFLWFSSIDSVIDFFYPSEVQNLYLQNPEPFEIIWNLVI